MGDLPDTKRIGTLTLHEMHTMNKKERSKVANWLRRQAAYVEKEGGKDGKLAKRYTARYHVLASVLVMLCLLVSGCAAVTNVDKIGNEYAQHSYSRNFWWPNYDRAVFCWKLDEKGFCPKEDTRVETITVTAQESAGQGAAKAAVGSMPMALGLGLGLAHSGSRISQSVGGFSVNEHFSTKFFQK